MNDLMHIIVAVESILLLFLVVVLVVKVIRLSKIKERIREHEIYELKRDDFFPMLVHELRAPLSVIKGASDLMLKDANNLSGEQIHTLLSQIKTSSSSLLRMVNDILDVSKLESGKFEINKTFGNINDVLKEECAYFESSAKIEKVTLTTNLDNNLQNFSFDADRVKQVLTNLISNAIKFTPEGGVISVESVKKERFVNIAVCDTGVGISDEDKPKLFHKFAQANNHAGVKEKGTGLGLVISKGIVTAHGGDIWIEDNKPKGACFIFSLPLS